VGVVLLLEEGPPRVTLEPLRRRQAGGLGLDVDDLALDATERAGLVGLRRVVVRPVDVEVLGLLELRRPGRRGGIDALRLHLIEQGVADVAAVVLVSH
jgi:hypothetical protein